MFSRIILFGLATVQLISCLAIDNVIEGVVNMPPNAPKDWSINTRIQLDDGLYMGFVQPNGSFAVHGLPSSSSFMVEVVNPSYIFTSYRVDINSRGKIRARQLNILKPSEVQPVAYPLVMTTLGKAEYFQPREEMRTLDLLMNPSILITLVAFGLIMILPKIVDVNDSELQQMTKMTNKGGMADISELLSSLSGNATQQKSTSKRPAKPSAIRADSSQGEYSAARAGYSNAYTAPVKGYSNTYASAAPCGVNKKSSKSRKMQ